ncbi:putative RNA recognition motif domain, nucleotide-binding alpha-beta plait domain superfamily [Helianthus annuus]|nr:putative RNA recognition motif domain, nucleotide-binding alpha-beta plait domain superfamily [Helianthus annuus]
MITKFFVANLPDGCTPWELRKALEGYGDIAGTYVAKKKDKGGGRFGFVSFSNVRDRGELESSLRGARMGYNKLKVNIARFAVENSGFGAQKEVRANVRVPDIKVDKSRNFNGRDSRSYCEVLGKTKNTGNGTTEVGNCSRNIEKSLVVPDRTVAFQDLHDLALVGRAVDLETLVDIDRLLRIARIEYSRIHYLGGLSILISFTDSGSASEFLSARTVWGPWFSRLDTWNGQSLSLERVIWLKVHGIPLHIFDPGLLDQIGGSFGKVLYLPDTLDDELDLSMVRVGVLGGESYRIREYIVLKWKDRSYRVWVEEEESIWIPDFLKRFDASPSGEDSPLQSSPVGQFPFEDDGGIGDGRKMDSQPVGEGSGDSISKEDIGKVGGNDDRSAEGFLHEHGMGPYSKVGGDNAGGIFFFNSKKRSRRFRKRAGRTQSRDPVKGHGDFLDSCERIRPTKRNRAQMSNSDEDLFSNRAQEAVNSDLFSLNRLLVQPSGEKEKDEGGETQEEARPASAPVEILCLNQMKNQRQEMGL